MEIPELVDDVEKITRIIYHPILLNGKGEIRSNAFKPPANSDEVSIIRLDYSTLEFCKNQGKKFENPDHKKNYYGLSFLSARSIRYIGADVVSSPIQDTNPAHGDIKIGYITKRNEPLPSKYSWITSKLAETALLVKDPDIYSEKWKVPYKEIEILLREKEGNLNL